MATIDQVLEFPYQLSGFACEVDAKSTLNSVLSLLKGRLTGLQMNGENFELQYHGKRYIGYVKETHTISGSENNTLLQGTVEVVLTFPRCKGNMGVVYVDQIRSRERLNRRLVNRLKREFEELLPMERPQECY